MDVGSLPGGTPGQLAEVKKAIYGLSDGPLDFFRHVEAQLGRHGWTQSKPDPCFFHFHEAGDVMGLIAMSTDDTVFAGERRWLEKRLTELRKVFVSGKVEWNVSRTSTRIMCDKATGLS